MSCGCYLTHLPDERSNYLVELNLVRRFPLSAAVTRSSSKSWWLLSVFCLKIYIQNGSQQPRVRETIKFNSNLILFSGVGWLGLDGSDTGSSGRLSSCERPSDDDDGTLP